MIISRIIDLLEEFVPFYIESNPDIEYLTLYIMTVFLAWTIDIRMILKWFYSSWFPSKNKSIKFELENIWLVDLTDIDEVM